MSFAIKLLMHQNRSTTGHLFCSDCATELDIDLRPYLGYRNPRYTEEWNLTYHDFHSVRVLYPGLLKVIWDGQASFECPYCGCINQKKFIVMDKGAFDIRLIKDSIESDSTYYVCEYCEVKYVGHANVVSMDEGYVCRDCLQHMKLWS